jgi:urease accessory protein
VAGHTQSATLEGALGHGLEPADVPRYVDVRLRTVTAVEAATAVVARHLAADLRPAGELTDLEVAWAARTPSPALRSASRTQARALLHLAQRVWPEAKEVALVRELGAPSRAVVLGALAAHLGLGPAPLARLVGYDDVQTVCAAALKLLPLDPAVVAGWVHAALPAVALLAADVADLTRAEEIPMTGNPTIEAWAQAHAATTRRLFRA